jgi:methionine aminotransferase
MQSKLPNVGTTIFSTMSALALEHKALNLGQGFPSFSTDPDWGNRVKKHIDAGRNQYAPMPGVPELRSAIAQKISRTHGVSVDADTEITVTAGATQAIFTAIMSLIHPGDEVILFAPAYDCYAPAITLCGAKPVWINLHYPDYHIPWEEVKSVINEKTRMIIINHPHNPSGAVLEDQDLRTLNDLAKAHQLLVLSDEVYEHIVFDDRKMLTALNYEYLREHAIIVYSFGKTLHMTGWKMGYAIASESLTKEFRKVHQYNVFSCNTPVQYALAEYLDEHENYQDIGLLYQAKRNVFTNAIQHNGLQLKPASGTYFQLIHYGNIDQRNDVEVAIEWTKKYKLTTIPCSVFYPDQLDEKVLRVCFAKEDNVLEEAAAIINTIHAHVM